MNLLNKGLFLSAHSDDESLFGAYLIQKEKPLVVVCTDCYTQDNLKIRRDESKKAMDILGADLWFLGIQDDLDIDVYRHLLKKKLLRMEEFDVVYAPNPETSNKHHKATAEIAKKIFKKVVYYDTYNNSWGTNGLGTCIIPTDEMRELKKQAMDCYKSQIEREQTKKHFSEIWNEYVSY